MTTRVALQPAYVLHRRPYRESSLLLEILSADFGDAEIFDRAVVHPLFRDVG